MIIQSGINEKLRKIKKKRRQRRKCTKSETAVCTTNGTKMISTGSDILLINLLTQLNFLPWFLLAVSRR